MACIAASVACAQTAAERPAPRRALWERIVSGPEIIGIVHWGLNTYTDREWGYGDEDPAMLNPARFDADQIVGACKAGGIGGLVVVAKHHDGFCLWPTKTTGHNISKSPFRCMSAGVECRDYVKAMSDACRRAGLKFGIYCSPWDRNNAHYGTEKYVTDVFQRQLRELLSGDYGEVFEMWFDGANGGDGFYGGARERRKIPSGYYRYETETFAMVRRLQPGVCIFNELDAADFRFGGNERGLVDPDSRATGGHYDGVWENYRKWSNTGLVDGTTFHPIEADFPLRKGWFYHEKDRGTTKCAAYLTKLYLSSVGNAATMNIGIAPNRDGLLDADDVKALAGFGVMRRALFAREARPGGPFNVVVMKEDVSKGEHVDGWRVLADGREILRGRSVGMKRIRLLAEPVAAGKCEVEVTAGCGKVELRRYIADAELVKTILEADADSGETDTAKWMTAAAADLAAPAASASAGREESLEGAGWRFARDATGELRAEAPDFDDSSWGSVRIPHDWAISGPFDRTKPGGTGMLPWKGVGWYRRKFTLSAEDAAGCVYLDFDGVMASPEVYVNGEKAGGWDYGYASFRVDATPFVRAGVNTLAVRADTRHHDSRWYPGAGIYRRVSLKTRGKAHFAYNGVFATTPEVSADSATVDIAWELEGDVPGGASVEIHVAAPDSSMRLAASAPAAAGNVSWKMEKPRLWDVEAPNLYTAEARLVHGGHVLSSEKIRFGVRTIAFPVPLDGPAASDRAANGFHLNGRRVQFKGVNLHSDLGLLGMAFDESAARRQLKIMKEMGVNAVRTSHNIPAPQFLDLCDEMGILVWDECFDRWDGKCGRRADQKLEDYVARNLRAFVRRDRNHPCVVIWSMCNEILPASTDYFGPGGYKDGMTRERCRYFREQMRLEDRTRPVGNGNISWSDAPEFIGEGIFDDLDITGWNYHASYRNIKRMRPSKPVVYSESASCVSSQGACSERLPRGTYDHDVATFQASGYDFCGTEIPDWEFRRMEEDVYCCGEFVWTGFDYLGEPTPYNRESRSSYYGIVDLTGVPKDRYWLYRSHWNKEADTLHLVPHWTWPRSRGRKIPVFVYANADSVELFVNGRSAGRREKGVMYDGPGRPSSYYDVCANYRFMWYGVPYEPGELKAVAWRGGRIVGEKTVCTAGEPVALSAVAEPKLTDSPDELVWVGVGAIDSKGERCPAADARVSFSIEGPGEIVAVGNGNAHEFEPFTKTDSHPLFCGRAMAVVRRTGGGAIRLKVSAAGFVPAAVELP